VAKLGRRGDAIPSRGYYTSSSEDETDKDIDKPVGAAYGHTSPNPIQRRKHLYVVLDDWKKGFSIHKLDLDDGSDGGDLTLRAPVHRLATGDRYWNFAALGNKIVAAGRINSEEDGHATVVYDTEMAGLSIVRRLPADLHGQRWYLAAAVGNGLYTVDTSSSPRRQHGSMHLFEDVLAPETCEKYSWSRVETPLPFSWVHGMESSAVHPEAAEGGGRTLFMSMGKWNKMKEVHGAATKGKAVTDNGYVHISQTFSYNTGSGEWRRHGKWDLPFHGHAHYDYELDAWVGLQKRYKHDPNSMARGYLCWGDVVSPDGSAVRRPAWKLSAERLFDPDMESHIGASLVSMGDSNYCLVEVMAHESFMHGRCADIGNKSVIRVATFRLKYGKKGELTLTARRPDRSYLFNRFDKTSQVRAFWM
jgi:hypothetical protein